MLKVLSSHGDDEVARVFVAQTSDGQRIELVESVQPPVPRSEKWVLIVSTLKGCPVRCLICDAGGDYQGRLTAEEIFAQLDYLIRRRHPDGRVPARRLKIQFARMGDPAFNPAVLEVLEQLTARYQAPGLMPSISTVAPAGCASFFEELLRIKQRRYRGGRFQMQFSLHTSDEAVRRRLVPVQCWSFSQMAEYGRRFHQSGDRKIALNFAAARGLPLEPERLAEVFPTDVFLIKLTPINPTLAAARSGLESLLVPDDPTGAELVAGRFRRAGYQVIVSFGELRENQIGSNCGMYAAKVHCPGLS